MASAVGLTKENDIEELLKFINGEDEIQKRQSAKAAKRARQKQRKVNVGSLMTTLKCILLPTSSFLFLNFAGEIEHELLAHFDGTEQSIWGQNIFLLLPT